ncbi:hypothetical protein ACOMHN_057114 [Nucella lapillus]
MWLKIFAIALCTVYSVYAQSVTIDPFKSVFVKAVGSTLQVKCTSRNSVEWTSEPQGAMPNEAVKASASSGDNISTLQLVNINKSNEGTYRCTDFTTQDQVSFELKVFKVMTSNSTFEYKVDTELECRVTDHDPQLVFAYSWKKGDMPVEKIQREGKQDFVAHENGSLSILHPARRFAGMYTCSIRYEDKGKTLEINVDVPYYAKPKVLPFEKSKNLVQEEKLVVECEILGYPKPSITWKKGDVVITGKMDSRYTLTSANAYDGKPVDNARLEIKSVEFDDAGEYTCIAMHSQWPNFNSSQPILVRVKDKLAALWPFLGIVAEVVILCTIIFIYEKKRNKDAMMEEDEDEDGTTPEKKSDSVRHRPNTNNPQA